MRILRQPASAHTHASHTLCSRAACSQSRQAPSRAGSGQRGRARACMRATFCSAHIWAWRSRPPSCARGAEKSSVLCVAISRVCRGARPSFLVVYTCSLNVITRAVVNLTRIFILISPRPSLKLKLEGSRRTRRAPHYIASTVPYSVTRVSQRAQRDGLSGTLSTLTE